MYSKIIGSAYYVPDNKVLNKYFEGNLDTSDEWIKSRTGIESRYISTGENTSDLGYEAGKLAIENSKINKDEIDIVIFATLTPDKFMPSTACLVQDRLGIENACAFDISAACSGFVYALGVADSMLKNNIGKTALVIGGEVLSKGLDYNDRSTCILFGDGAGAVVLRQSPEPGIINTYLRSKGDGENILSLDALPLKSPFIDSEQVFGKLTMEGREVFKFSKEVIGESIFKVLEGTEYTLDDVKVIIPHQANDRLIDYAAKNGNIDKDKFYLNMYEFGNTSAGSIPIALNEVIDKKIAQEGDLIILVGFGGGLTWGSLLIKL